MLYHPTEPSTRPAKLDATHDAAALLQATKGQYNVPLPCRRNPPNRPIISSLVVSSAFAGFPSCFQALYNLPRDNNCSGRMAMPESCFHARPTFLPPIGMSTTDQLGRSPSECLRGEWPGKNVDELFFVLYERKRALDARRDFCGWCLLWVLVLVIFPIWFLLFLRSSKIRSFDCRSW